MRQAECTDFIPKLPTAAGITGTDYCVLFNVQYGYYNTMESLIDEIQRSITEGLANHLITALHVDDKGAITPTKLDREKWLRLRYNSAKKKVNVVLHPGTSLSFDPHLATILGIRDITVYNKTNDVKTVAGTGAADLSGGIHSLYVYTDVVENLPVGDTQAPLLRIVDATGNTGENVHRIFNPARYVAVNKRRFDSIEIDIRSDTGESIPFESGRLSTTLHFRRMIEGFLPQ